MKYIGAHVSASGGVENAPVNAHQIGANTFALFTKNQRQWVANPLTDKSIRLFKERCSEYGFDLSKILPHNSYLTNMGSPEEDMRLKSKNAFLDEMQRCEQLGLNLLNFHPGSHLNKISEEECLLNIAHSINDVLAETSSCIAVLENTAGQGSNMGYRFSHLAYIIEHVENKERIGVCLDTAHLLASGYEIRNKEAYEAMWKEFEETIGLQYLRGIHLNDSMKDLGTRVDRHHSLGKGVMGLDLYSYVMKDSRLDNIPIILETPDDTIWAEEIAYLRSLE
ncbi:MULTISPECIES: deoxyribonuclease IV [Porphyromonas]|uniref:Probable endonuclease 4 n=1 Tax=Porphyromonas canoris TaxID=36875 RepID=A0ABR4XM72_9PORP|nr:MULTISPECIES: deoxyribonuclease IV [Porphyromonas]KGN70738.1 endonuclease IV [Porphyromonas sp. COT-108 OH1349]KGN93103.1 endonuclease IV [Porphyromonas canoris]